MGLDAIVTVHIVANKIVNTVMGAMNAAYLDEHY